MGSNNDQSEVEYDLDLTPPDVEQSIVIIKKQTPPVARHKKIFHRLDTLAFSTHEEAKAYLKLNILNYKYAFLLQL